MGKKSFGLDRFEFYHCIIVFSLEILLFARLTLTVWGTQYNKGDARAMPREKQQEHLCCDMRGMLSFMLLWLLCKRPMYGQELAVEIAKRRGEKPNPGTIYPALKDLHKRGLVQMHIHGRRTIYELTKEGQVGVTEAVYYFTRVFGEIIQFREVTERN